MCSPDEPLPVNDEGLAVSAVCQIFPNEENPARQQSILDSFLNSLFPPLIWHELSLLRTDSQAGLLPAGQAHLN